MKTNITNKQSKNNSLKREKDFVSFRERSCTSPVHSKTIITEVQTQVRESYVDDNRRVAYTLKTVVRHPKENFDKYKVSDFALENLTAAGVSLNPHSAHHSSLETVSLIQSQLKN